MSARNDLQDVEAEVYCIVCARRWHQVCALHLNEIRSEGFVCNTCKRDYNIKCEENRFKALALTENELAKVLEKRVNDFLRGTGCQAGHVTIRILVASNKVCEVKPRLKEYYQGQVLNGYPYRTKAIFAFQEIDGVDVVFFGMYVQEYDENCQAPNARRIYISFLDFIDFFRPRVYREDIYQEILIGYLGYAKQLGYVNVHIWAYPPSEDCDYIFYHHPPQQRAPTPKMFQKWFKELLDRALLEHVTIDYKVKRNIFRVLV